MGECSPGMEKFTLPSREELIRVVTQGLTSYARPTELASFSYDERRRLHFDRSQLVWCPRQCSWPTTLPM